MLYLPPQIAHLGVSESDDCMTYSIGFRAPKIQELRHEFLNYLQDHTQAEGLYADPDLNLQNHPAEISDDMIHKVSEMLNAMTWDKAHVADFLGKYLSEPKIDVVFTPNKKISKAEFNKQLASKTLWLSLKSQLLFTNGQFYLNGEMLVAPAILHDLLKQLADHRHINSPALPANIHAAFGDAILDAYLAGYVCFKR
jgi:50S ribosomal protein L16 3-hydroxylase